MPTLPPAPFAPKRRYRRGGFTMLEMLIAIGVITILIGIAVVGLSQIAKHSKAQHTKAVLAAVQAMMTEFEASGGAQSKANFKNTTEIANAPTGMDTTVPAVYPNGASSWQEYTDRVLAQLLTLPANRAILNKLPSDQVRLVPNPVPNQAPLNELLDGFGHPILYVPSCGLNKVTSSARPGVTLLLQSDGRLHDPANKQDRAANARPFFLSVGADNDPLQVDDNQYSFE